MRGRFAPLAVRPFSRLLASYTVNELGDSVGIVALAILVYDRTAGRRADRRVLHRRPSSCRPCWRRSLTARLDQIALRRSLPGLYVLEAAAFAALALIASGDFFLPLVLALALLDGALAITGRSLTRGAVASVLQPAALLKEGNALMNIGFAVAVRRWRRAGRPADRAVRGRHRAAGRRRVVPDDRDRPGAHARPARGLTSSASRSASASRPACASRAAATRRCGSC